MLFACDGQTEQVSFPKNAPAIIHSCGLDDTLGCVEREFYNLIMFEGHQDTFKSITNPEFWIYADFSDGCGRVNANIINALSEHHIRSETTREIFIENLLIIDDFYTNFLVGNLSRDDFFRLSWLLIDQLNPELVCPPFD